jgi:hypothetical protein
MHEFYVDNTTVSLIRSRPLIGGSVTSAIYGSVPDSEDVCFYHDIISGDKLAILDERSRSGK